MTNECCPQCETQMVEQFYTDPSTGDKVKQLQCCACGHSEKAIVEEE